jgi:hypothetical protein
MANRKKGRQQKRRPAAIAPSKPVSAQPNNESIHGIPQQRSSAGRALPLKGPDISLEYSHVKSDLVRLAAVTGLIFVAFAVLALILK